MDRKTEPFLGRLWGRRKPGLMSRLSHLIVVQVIFVFAALALLIFAPHDNLSLSTQSGSHRSGFVSLVRSLNSTASNSEVEAAARGDLAAFSGLLQNAGKVRQAAFYLTNDSGTVIRQVLYDRDDASPSPLWNEKSLSMIGSRARWQVQEDAPPVIPLSVTEDYIVYCSPVRVGPDRTAVFAAAWDHELLFSDRGTLGYALLILFLCAGLVALLTVYLIHRHFSRPLARMIKAFEKTSNGELYYRLENAGENELNRLTGVFNRLSRSLWKDQKQLQEFDDRLRVTNSSLRESRRLLSAVIDNSPVGIITADDRNRIVIFNQKAAELFGRPPQSAIGRPIDDLFVTAVDRRVAEEAGDTPDAGCEVLARRSDDSQFPAYLIRSALIDDDGNVLGCLYILRDISQSKEFQQMMIRLDRYYTRGEMASEIAHEINNYLSILMGNIELVPLLLRRGKHESLDKKLELMHTTVEKIARFTDGLLDGSHDDIRFARADINQLVENVLAFLKPQNRFDSTEVVTDLSSEIPLVEIDPGLIQQVLVNLIYNAADAVCDLDSERRILIRTAMAGTDQQPLLAITVHDNGPGVPSDKEALLFRKRFTTKPNGHGIGLITCRKILDSHLGDIAYRYDHGALFSISVPVEHPVGTAGVPASDAAKALTG